MNNRRIHDKIYSAAAGWVDCPICAAAGLTSHLARMTPKTRATALLLHCRKCGGDISASIRPEPKRPES